MAAATASDAADQVVSLLKSRKTSIKDERRELDAEDRRIDKALDAMGSVAPRRRGRPPALPAGPSTSSNGAKSPSKRTRKGGTRAEQALKMVVDAGVDGIDASKIAKAMKIKPNYLYRVMGGLADEKLVRKDGRRYFAVTK